MLLRFETQNCFSIRDVAELSLVASALKDEAGPILETSPVPGVPILSSALIYGANASGKSNIVAAIDQMRSFVLYSHSQGSPEGQTGRRSFALDASYSKVPTSFEVDVVVGGKRYVYRFSITDDLVESESLYAFPNNRRQTLFEREFQKFTFGRNLRGRNQTISDLTRKNSLFLSAAAQNGHAELLSIYRFFNEVVINTSIDVSSTAALIAWKDRDELDRRILEFLRAAGTGVVGYKRQEEEYPEKSKEFNRGLHKLLLASLGDRMERFGFGKEDEDKNVTIQLAHMAKGGDTVFFDLDRESSGTRRLLVILEPIFLALDSGGLIVIDELDASLHTKACEAVLALFSSREINTKGAQLIATTHDTNLLSSKLIRRDQVWFCEKANTGETTLFPLTDIKIRAGDNIEKGYLQGRFGAIPFSGSLAELFRNIHDVL